MAPLLQTEALVQIDLTPRKPVAKPAWLKARAPMGETFHNLKKLARELNLHTVCESAQCPNIGECWNQKSATFMMLGNLCTRRCGFCAVPKGKPEPIDHEEPARVAYAVAQLGLKHAVITSVNRDDDNLGAAQAFVNVITEIRRQAPGCRVEVLTPDFQGVAEARRLVMDARPEILNHNIETVPRLYRVAKSGGRYERSLEFLDAAKRESSFACRTGPSLPRPASSSAWARRCTSCSASSATSPTARWTSSPSGSTCAPRDHLPMARFYTPDEFAFLKHEALAMGFRHVESGPLVRSSYHAQEQAESTGLA
jgi:lipoic acid synthetase